MAKRMSGSFKESRDLSRKIVDRFVRKSLDSIKESEVALGVSSDGLFNTVLAAALGLETDEGVKQVRDYMAATNSFMYEQYAMGQAVDNLLGFRQSVRFTVPGIGTRIIKGTAVRSVLLNNFRTAMDRYDESSRNIRNMPAAMLISQSEDLEDRILAACELKRDEVMNWDSGVDTDDFETRVKNIKSYINRPLDYMEGYSLGVPRDFYFDVLELMDRAGESTFRFFMREVRKHCAEAEVG